MRRAVWVLAVLGMGGFGLANADSGRFGQGRDHGDRSGRYEHRYDEGRGHRDWDGRRDRGQHRGWYDQRWRPAPRYYYRERPRYYYRSDGGYRHYYPRHRYSGASLDLILSIPLD